MGRTSWKSRSESPAFFLWIAGACCGLYAEQKKTSRLLFTTSFDLRGQRGDGNREASLMFMSPLVV